MKASDGGAGFPAIRVMEAWTRLENALRGALPVCSVQPPTQPAELLSALRINHRIGPEEEGRITALREARNRIAHAPEDPSEREVELFEKEAKALIAIIKTEEEAC